MNSNSVNSTWNMGKLWTPHSAMCSPSLVGAKRTGQAARRVGHVNKMLAAKFSKR